MGLGTVHGLKVYLCHSSGAEWLLGQLSRNRAHYDLAGKRDLTLP